MMAFFRRNIIRIVVIISLQTGMTAYAMPAAAHGRAYKPFTIWLSHYLDKNVSGSARSRVLELSRHAKEAPHFIALVSRIISGHGTNGQAAPGKATSTQQDIYHLLLTEWNLCHQASGMSNGATVDQSKSGTLFNHEPGLPSYTPAASDLVPFPVAGIPVNSGTNGFSGSLRGHPLANGIAIGAP